MKRSDLLYRTAALGIVTVSLPVEAYASPAQAQPAIVPLAPPADGVPVAFLISDGVVMIDFAGPWEVFQDAHVTERTQTAFDLFTVAENASPVVTSGGATIVPKYTLAAAPSPRVVVVPAQSDPSAAVKSWLQDTARHADLVMSVCTGALVLAQAGLLDGHAATTHHSALATLAMHYPAAEVVRGVRFVDNGRIATSAGLSAGIDLALHVVARYYGKNAARLTAYDMEYQSDHWLTGDNSAYRKPPLARAGDAICPVCWMEVDPKSSPTLVYRGHSYYFCMPAHQQIFGSAPQRFLNYFVNA